MNVLCAIAVIYVTIDLVVSAYVVHKRGDVKATVRDIKQNLGLEEDEDVYDRW